MDFERTQIPPPKDWEQFEELCLALWQEVWTDPLALKNGRRGQPQCGVDVYGQPGGHGAFHGVQCKGKDQGYGSSLTSDEVLDEIKKAERFKPPMARYVIATTAVRDVRLQQLARELTVEREARGEFPVAILSWEDLQSMIGGHRRVLERFYPQYAADVQGLLQSLRSLTSAQTVASLSDASISRQVVGDAAFAWVEVQFAADRDIGPALLGRGLGPGDALACPRLAEADSLVAELRRAFSARLSGVPGAGKSVCCFQAAATLRLDGWAVKSLAWPPPADLRLPEDSGEQPVLYVVDDAHRLPLSVIYRLEHAAGPTRYVLSTFNAAETGDLGVEITLDAERAVRTIAASLSKDPRTLQAVVRVDDRVGEGFLDEDLQERITSAEMSSAYPWQFCFILGGGWRRAGEVVATCKAEGTVTTLAVIALLQLVTRDKPAEISDLEELLSPAGISGPVLRAAVESLIGRRLLLGASDLRTPHQRFAVALLAAIGRSVNPSDREALHEMCRLVVTHSSSTLAGIRLLMSELRFQDHWLEPRFWSAPVMEALRKRCFDAQTPDERMYAAFWLAEQHGKPWSSWAFITNHHIALFGRWITEVQHPAGYGLHSLLNNIYNNDETLMTRIVLAADARSVAAAASTISLSTAGSTYALVDRSALARSNEWSLTFVAALDREQLFRELSSWTDLERGVHFASSVCWALTLHDEKLGWDVLEVVTPLLQKAFASDPINAFRTADEIVSNFLHVWDPLGVWKRPSARQRSAVAKLLVDVDIGRLAAQMSRSSWRELHSASHFLGFLLAADRKKANSLLSAIDLDRVAENIGDRWKALDHESMTFLLQFGRDKKNLQRIERLLLVRSSEIRSLPARLAMVAPSAAVSVLSAGGQVALAKEMGLGWQVVALVVYQVGRLAPEQMRRMLAPHVAKAAESWTSSQINLYEHVDMFVALLEQFGLDEVMQEILDKIDRTKIEIAWVKVLREGGASARSVAFLVEHAVRSQNTEIRKAALRIRGKFPSSSKPTDAARKRYLMD